MCRAVKKEKPTALGLVWKWIALQWPEGAEKP
jgi:hypothetical protein